METTRDGLRAPTRLDAWIAVAQSAVSVISGATPARRPDPAAVQRLTQVELAPDARRHSAALMRVNHVGEICAQAMYEAQALATQNHELRVVFRQAAAEEADHLAWTRDRVDELGDRVSLLAPLWYAGAFAIGYAAAALGGDRASLGFMAETENQVEEHLHSHLERLPPDDRVSRAIVEQMKAEEVGHAQTAREHGGVELPLPARWAMRLAARVMTTTAYYL